VSIKQMGQNGLSLELLYNMFTKEQIEEEQKTPDFWNYNNEPDDQKRKEIILSLIEPCNKILDIGACEGFITKDLPAKQIHAIEISDYASSRLPPNIKRISEPEGEYDVVLATGIFYNHYDYKQIIKWIEQAKPKVLIIAGIEGVLLDYKIPTKEIKFPYRGMLQIIRKYDGTE